MSTEITLAEAVELESLEKTITDGLQTFEEVGNALKEIRDGKLYRATHSDFETYCKERWNIGRTHADRLVAAAKVMEILPPIGGTPTSEAVARPLTTLHEPEQIVEAWETALEATDGAPPTAKEVKAAVRSVAVKHTPPEPKAKVRSAVAGKALKRIETVCGKNVAKAIVDGTLQLENAELVAWAAEEEDMMRNMQELIVGQRWAPSKAARFLNRFPDGKTTVDDIVILAIAMGGEFEMSYGGGKLVYRRDKR